MTQDIYIEWREIGQQAWNYATGTLGKSRGELTRHMLGWQARNPTFEFRIRPMHKHVDCPCWQTGQYIRIEGCIYHPWDL